MAGRSSIFPSTSSTSSTSSSSTSSTPHCLSLPKKDLNSLYRNGIPKEEGTRRVRIERQSLFNHGDDSIQLQPFVPIIKSESDSTSESLPESLTESTFSKSNSNSIQYLQTGTTIVGIVLPNHDTVILAADTRSTNGNVVADKRCEKVHPLARNVWACGAGTSGDIEAMVRNVRYTFHLRGLLEDSSIGNGCLSHGHNHGHNHDTSHSHSHDTTNNDWYQNLPNANLSSMLQHLRSRLYTSRGQLGVNLVIGGYDCDSSMNNPRLLALHPHGSIDVVPYTALGSGGLAAMSVLDSRYRPDMTLEEGMRLVRDAVGSGISNDLGSGSRVDMCVIRKEGVIYTRGVVPEESLLLVDHDGDVGDEHDDGTTTSSKSSSSSSNSNSSRRGVNGFGTLPYRIQNCRVLMESESKSATSRKDWLDKIW